MRIAVSSLRKRRNIRLAIVLCAAILVPLEIRAQGLPNLTLTKTADSATVSAGSEIGFTVTASNSSAGGTGTATGVSLSDPLPGGAGLDWSIEAGPANCSITGAVGSEVLTCSAVDLAPGASLSAHVTSSTTFASCGSKSNTVTLAATNAPGLSASATTTVLCPDVTLSKTADNATVSAGSEIGFTVTASNSSAGGTGTATDVVISDPLPSGLDWVVVSGPVTCSITGPVGSEVLTCLVGDLAPGASLSAHVTGPTTSANCGTLTNSATLTGSNAPELTASANSTILCLTGTPTNTPTPTPTNTPTSTPTRTPTPTTTGAPVPAPAVPTLNPSGMLVFGLLIAAAGLLLLIRRG